MTDSKAPAGSLGDFFAKKGKNKKAGFKASNLNVQETKTEEKKTKETKGKEEEGWEEELVVAPTMKVETVGKLTRDEDKKEEEDSVAPAWGTAKSKGADQQLNDKRFPTLAKATRSSNINLDDEPKVNIKTTKNAFAALEDEDDENEKAKRPKTLKPAMIQKKKGESEKVALQRELKQYEKDKKKAKKAEEEDEEDDEESEEDEEEEEEVVERKAKSAPKKKEKKVLEAAPAKPAEEEQEQLFPKIDADLTASKKKYEGRRKPEKQDIPREELEAEKENKPKQQPSSKKKKMPIFEEDEKPKLLVWEED